MAITRSVTLSQCDYSVSCVRTSTRLAIPSLYVVCCMFVLCFVANKLSHSLALSQLSSHLHSVRDWSVLVMTSSQMMNNNEQRQVRKE